MLTKTHDTKIKHAQDLSNEDNPQYRNKSEVIITLGLCPEQLFNIEKEIREWLSSRPDICSLHRDSEKEAVNKLITDLSQKHEFKSTEQAIYKGLRKLIRQVLYNQRRSRAAKESSRKASQNSSKILSELKSSPWRAIILFDIHIG